MEAGKKAGDHENSQNRNSSYTFSEDMAILNYVTENDRYLKCSGIQIWKDAEKLQICTGRSYLSMKERFRKVIVKDLKKYNVEKTLAVKITQFMRATQRGKHMIRMRQQYFESKSQKENHL